MSNRKSYLDMMLRLRERNIKLCFQFNHKVLNEFLSHKHPLWFRVALFFKKHWLFMLNFFVLQWFFVRLSGIGIRDEDFFIHHKWKIMGLYLPLTGWWSRYIGVRVFKERA